MSKYVPDILSRRWVIISSQRLDRPDEFKKGRHSGCPFCPGHESQTTAEVFRVGGGEKDQPGWQIRVIPNKYPITDFHEVIILSPDCKKDLAALSLEHAEKVFQVYKDRYNFYRKKGQVFIFSNHGEHAGTSITHPHSQLVVIPFQINLDTLSREPLNNLVEETRHFQVYCPDFSQWPYEAWISARAEGTVFGDISTEEINELARLLQKMLKKLYKINLHHPVSHLSFGYNFYIHPKENWYIRIIPRLMHRAGFELGTGLSVNIVDPTDAAKAYRGESGRVAHVMSRLKQHIR